MYGKIELTLAINRYTSSSVNLKLIEIKELTDFVKIIYNNNYY